MDELIHKYFDRIVVESGALLQVVSYLESKGCTSPLLVVDENTYQVAGKWLEEQLLHSGVKTQVCHIKPNEIGDVVADEVSLVQLLLDIDPSVTDMLVAVGSGTIHDIARFASHKTGIPFVSIPTAPSVDGYASVGAPLIIRGMKQTFPAIQPIAIFADLDILTKAPQAMIAAGFGDMIGKFTSLFDWKFSHLTADEPYDEQVAEITANSLKACVQNATGIGSRSEEGIKALTNALIESGIAMMLFGKSHPASAAEHHLSHYWEMEYLNTGKRALLHGAKVGVACAEISRIYHDAVWKGIYPGQKPWQLDKYKEQIEAWMAEMPTETEIKELLKQVGGETHYSELGIPEELYKRSVHEAHHIRDRHTLLRALNEAK